MGENKIKLSVVIPCFNEESTLKECVDKVRKIADKNLVVEIIIVDDGSSDGSANVAKEISSEYSEIIFVQHKINRGKGAALRTGFEKVTGDYVAIQDADLEYDPVDFKNLLVPLINNKADVVIGSRFLSVGPHRVLFFWHSIGNKLLTFLSNMFTDLNLTDIESGYKIFKRDIIKKIEIEEDRFGFEPEIIAKVSHLKLRIYEMGVSYFGRTYEEGKKIGFKDGIRALYCIFKYNASRVPFPMRILLYTLLGISTVLFNGVFFSVFLSGGIIFNAAVILAFAVSTSLNYPLLKIFLYRVKGKLITLLIIMGVLDFGITKLLIDLNFQSNYSKILSIILVLLLGLLLKRLWPFYKRVKIA
jgi:dolichol-phosphate mannosyltransferase